MSSAFRAALSRIGAALLLAFAFGPANAQTLTITNATYYEGDSGTFQAGLSLDLSAPVSSPVTVRVATANGTASAGSDYVAIDSTVTIPANTLHKFVYVTVNSDTTPEPDETFTVNLSNATGATIGDAQGLVTLLSDDASVSVNDVTLVEGNSGSKYFVFNVSLSNTSTKTITFDYTTVAGTASAGNTTGADFLPDSGASYAFFPGETQKTFAISVYGDNVVEGDETFQFIVSNVVNATVADGTAIGTILNDDTGPATISINSVTLTEGNSGTQNANFTVQLSSPQAGPVSFNIATADLTATAGSDYVAKSQVGMQIPAGSTTQTFSVVVNGDSVHENDETFNVNLSSPSGAALGYPKGTGKILNDDLVPLTIAAQDVFFTEMDSGTWNESLQIQLSRPTDVDVTFDITTADGTATAGSDYQASQATGLVIPAGQTSVSFVVPVFGDIEKEADETFLLVLSNVQNAPPPAGPGIITIWNDDEGGPILSVGDASVVEGNAGSKAITFNATLSEAASVPVSFTYYMSSGGTAQQGNDYTGADGVVVEIPAGSLGASFSFTVYGDTVGEPDETFSIRIDNIHNATMIQAKQPTGTIVNDDPVPSLSISDVTVSEGDTGEKTMWVTVNLSEPSVSGVSYDLAMIDGTGTNGADYYLNLADHQSMQPGETSAVFGVSIVGDTAVEGDETFTVQLSNANGATIADGVATETISNDDGASGPRLSVSDAWTDEGNSGTHLLNFTVTLSAAQAGPVSFDIATANVTAVAGSDYTAKAVTGMQIPAGQTSATFSVAIAGDALMEMRETFVVNLSNAVGAAIGDGQGEGTIENDESNGSPPPTLSIADASVTEGDSGTKTLNFIVTMSSALAYSMHFDFVTSAGTATQGSDYDEYRYSTITMAPGQTSKTLAVTVYGDTNVEANETINATISNTSDASIADGSAVGTITNDDGSGGGGPTLSIGDVSIAEGNSGTKTMTFTVTQSAASATVTKVDVATANGTATSGSDYVAASMLGLRIPAGATSKTFAVTINGDTAVETDETFTVNLSNPIGATIADAQALGTISNDDSGGGGTPALSIADVSISEGNSGTKVATFTVTLSAAASGAVSYDIATTNGTATAGSDYVASSLVGQSIAAGQLSKTFAVTINGDTTNEPNETFNVNVSNVSGATVSDGSAVGTITNDDAASGPTLSIGDVSIAEGNSSTKTATFTVTLSAAQSGPVLFDIAAANGTATSGSDYVAKTTAGVRIAAGATSKTFTVTINGDTTQEPDETFTVNLSNPVGATIADAQAIGTITNDDAAATPTLSIADASVAEGNSGTKVLTFTVSLSPAAAGTVSYDIATSNGTATSGSDYVASSLVGQTIAAGGTSKTFAVTINGDATTEANETFNVTITNVSGATLGDGAAVGTITNDDGGGSGPSLSIGDVTVAEGNGLSKQVTFTVSLSAAASTAVTYNIATANGTATAPTDYTAKSLTGQSIAAGQTSKTFVVAVKGDTVAEANETFTVNVSSVVGATLADGQAIGTITNDDAALVSVARFDARGLVDDIDDHNREPVLSTGEYASLLLDTAQQLCRRAPGVTVVAVDGVENIAALADLADTAKAACANAPRYIAVMSEGEARGFLVEEGTAAALDKPTTDAAGLSSLQVLGAGHDKALTLLVPRALSANANARAMELKAIGQSVQAQLRKDAEARLVLIGGVTVPGLRDLTVRDFVQSTYRSALPGERVLLSPALLRAYGQAKVEFVPPAANEALGQLLQLQ